MLNFSPSRLAPGYISPRVHIPSRTVAVRAQVDMVDMTANVIRSGAPIVLRTLGWGVGCSAAGLVGLAGGLTNLDTAPAGAGAVAFFAILATPAYGAIGVAGATALQVGARVVAPQFVADWPFTLAGYVIAAAVGARIGSNITRR